MSWFGKKADDVVLAGGAGAPVAALVGQSSAPFKPRGTAGSERPDGPAGRTIRVSAPSREHDRPIESIDEFRERFGEFEAFAGALQLESRFRSWMASHAIALTVGTKTVLAHIAAAHGTLMLAQLRTQLAKAGEGEGEVTECPVSAQVLQQLYGATRAATGAEKGAGKDFRAQSTIYDSQFRELVERAIDLEASDIHFRQRNDGGEVRGDILFRIHGELEPVSSMEPQKLHELTAAAFAKSDSRSLAEGEGQFNALRPLSSFIRIPDLKHAELRFQSSRERYGFDVAIRLLNYDGKDTYYDLHSLRYLPEQIELLEEYGHGPGASVIFAGETGSGKTTALNALVASHPDVLSGIAYAASVEDPPEGRPPGLSQFPVARSADQGATGEENPFVPELRVRLRSDGDLLVLGEIRDGATAEIYAQLAMTGHKVLGSLHAGSSQVVYERLVSPLMGLSHETVASPDVLGLAVHQKLLPILCEHCRRPAREVWTAPLQRKKLDRLDVLGVGIDRLFVRNQSGCPNCRRGHVGMQVIAEMFAADDEQRLLIAQERIGEAFRLWRSNRRDALTEPGVQGKTGFEVGVYFASQGVIGVDALDEKVRRILSYEEVARHV